MKRLFEQHKIRKTIDLNGAWKFKLDPDNVGMNEAWAIEDLTEAEMVIVPSCWNNELRLLNYEGAAWYQRKFEVSRDDGGSFLFEFGSVMTKADVWIDGEWVCDHYGAFTAFSFIRILSPGVHTLTVRADNSFDAQSFPQRYTDWFNYGGIARDVSASPLGGLSILDNHIVYTLSDDLKSVKIHAELELYNCYDCEHSSELTVTVGENVIYEGSVYVDDGYFKFIFYQRIPSVPRSSPDYSIFKEHLAF